MISSIWVDADSIQKCLRTIVLRLGLRLNVDVYFVADRVLPDIKQFIAEDTHRIRIEKSDSSLKSKTRMIVVESGENSADDYIVNNADENSFCITHDIPLASRLLEKKITVIDDRGLTYTADNIKKLIFDRAINNDLRIYGVFAEQTKKHKPSCVKDFSDNLDREIRKKQVK